jgi:hypothetical protein
MTDPPDPVAAPPQNPVADPIVRKGSVFSPSPDPGEPLPKRRMEDTKSYAGEWTVLLIAIGTWGVTFLTEIATFETWAQLTTPRVLGLHMAQLLSTITSVVAAKRIR